MATLGVMKSRIADDLARSDLTSQIADAINDAIKHYEKERFYFNERRTITFDTVAAQIAYSTTENVNIPNLVRTDAVFVTQASSKFPLARYHALDFDTLQSTAAGRPSIYCFSERLNGGVSQLCLRFWPIPDAVYAMIANGVIKLPALADDNATNAWTTEAEEMIRSAAKARLFAHVLFNFEAAQAMGIIAEGIKSTLAVETSQRFGLGRITPTEF
jgi:hypothetical protein